METKTLTKTELEGKMVELEYEMHLLFQGMAHGAFAMIAEEGFDDANSMMSAIENEMGEVRKALKDL